jgi:hypothetical protein
MADELQFANIVEILMKVVNRIPSSIAPVPSSTYNKLSWCSRPTAGQKAIVSGLSSTATGGLSSAVVRR